VGLLERDEQLATLVDRFGRVDGAGHLVLLSGEAGAGKSALVKEFVEQHVDGVRVLVGLCDDLFAARPLGPLVDIARAHPGTLAAALAAGEPAQVHEAFLRDLATPPHPVVVVLEDLQWADEATLDLLRLVARRLDVLRCLVIATHRDDVGADHPLRRAWGSLVGPLVTRLTLPPLSVDAVATLAADTALDARAVHARTGGNPFFVTELVASEHASLPATVRDTILGRASLLRGPARDCLDAAAVLGRRSSPALVAGVGGTDEVALDECVAAGFLVADGDRVAFRHDLVREALEQALTPLRRRDLHRRALQELDGSDDVVRRAHHAVGAGDREAILDLAVRAADACVALGAHQQAAALYGTALAHADGLASGALLHLLRAYARTCFDIEHVAEAVAAGERVHALLAASGDDARLGEWETWLGWAYRGAGRADEAAAAAAAAVARLEPLGDSPALADALAGLAGQQMVAGSWAQAAATAQRALPLAERHELDEAAVRALDVWGTSTSLGLGDPAGIDLLEAALDAAKRAGLVSAICRTSSNLGGAHMACGDMARAVQVLSDGIALAEEHELLYRRSCLLVSRADAHLLLGRWDEAVDDAKVVHASAAAPHHLGFSLAVIGRVRARRGDPDPGTVLDEALAAAEVIGEPQCLFPVRIARAEAAWLAGDAATAAREVDAIAPLASRLEAEQLPELERWRRRIGQDGDDGRSAAAIRAEAADLRRRGRVYDAADVLGDSDDEADLRAALEALVALGARPRANQVTRRLRSLGVRDVRRGPRASTRANAAGLTARELDVARLIAVGLTNAEIAERLVVSPKTVDHHVSAVLSKLGVANRGKVAEAAGAVGLDLTGPAPEAFNGR
jgi:ATP/maltotriose-dependent transcriptional regulator MalT